MRGRPERLHLLVRRKKKENRFLSDLASAYGAFVLSLPYETQFGLWLNLHRPALQAADAVAQGIGVALSSEDLSLEYVDAVTPCAEAVEDERYARNFQRERQRMKARWKGMKAGG